MSGVDSVKSLGQAFCHVEVSYCGMTAVKLQHGNSQIQRQRHSSEQEFSNIYHLKHEPAVDISSIPSARLWKSG